MLITLLTIGIYLHPVVSQAMNPPAVDLDRLAYAVAVAETSNCTAGTGLSKKNCHGIAKRSGGFRVFATTEESFAEFKAMWPRVYGMRLPTRADAIMYTNNPEPDRWLSVVYSVYNR